MAVVGCGSLEPVQAHFLNDPTLAADVGVRREPPVDPVQELGDDAFVLWLEKVPSVDSAVYLSLLLWLGLNAGSGKLVVRCPEDFPGYSDVKDVCYRYRVPLASNAEDCVAYVRQRLGEQRVRLPPCAGCMNDRRQRQALGKSAEETYTDGSSPGGEAGVPSRARRN